MRAIAKALLMSACVLALVACGSDDKDDGGNAGTGTGGGGAGGAGEGGAGGAGEGGTSGAGEGGTSGTSGEGGTSGTSGAGGAAGTGSGGMMAPPVMCGGMTCPAPASASLRACCVDDGDVCGEEIRGGFIGECAVPAVPDDECEGVMLMSISVTGCCTPEGRCGIGAGIIFGEPCTSIEELQGLASDGGAADGDGGTPDGGGMFPNAPEPKACTP